MNSPVVATLLISLSVTQTAILADDTFHVGSARVDVTPEYSVRLNGFGFRREESEGVSQPLHARALAVSSSPDEPPLVLLTVDNLGVRLDMVDEVARRLERSHQLPRDRLALTFTHTHCAPKVVGASDNIFSTPIPPEHQLHIRRYTEDLTDWLTEAAQEAIDNRRPATLEWGVGTVGFAKNRRTEGGPVDHALPLLVVRDVDSGAIRALYVSYACHATVLSFNLVSGDWPGYVATLLERQHPQATALVSIGAGSDSNPASGVVGDKVDVAEGFALQITSEVERLLATDLRPVTGDISATFHRIDLPLSELPTREQFEALATKDGKDGYNARTQLERLDRGEELLRAIDYPIQTWAFGDSMCMVFLAGEVCVDYSLRLKAELDRERLWLNAYSNDFGCYIPSERLVQEGRYGGGSETPYFALPTTLKAGLEQLIVDEVHRQVPDRFEAGQGTQGIPPKSPEGSLNCMRTHDELRIDLVAAEPLVSDPVAIDFGPDGRVWVAEMIDYGHGVYETFEPSGRIRWLEDEDKDGTFDRSHTFVEGLRFPTDVKVWRDGVLICDAPHILFAQDSDGDGHADSTETLFSGFEVLNAQARVNSLRFGLDNWLYAASGLFGGRITSHLTGEVVDVSGRDFRMNPDTGEIEAATGRTQQGRDRNDWGDWFGCRSGTLLVHYPTEARYTSRNPYIAAPSPEAGVAEASALKLYPPDNLVRFELSGAPGTATAACGLGIYRDEALGPDYRGNAFTCEPVHQLVHRIVLERVGTGYRGYRAKNEAGSEFLTSTDNWFRPVQVRTGPDGALWVVDMYRYVIEHPRWIPQQALEELNVYAGQGRGRIYRISRRDVDVGPLPKLDMLPTSALVAQLDSPNGTIRDLAHQLLLWRDDSDKQTAVALQQLARTAATELGQLHALCVLDHLDALNEELLLAALGARQPELVRHAVRLVESRLNESETLQTAVLALADHSSPRVRRQVAWSLGEIEGSPAAPALASLLSARQDEAAIRAAALSSLHEGNVNAVFSLYHKLPLEERSEGIHADLAKLAIRIGSQSEIDEVLRTATPDPTDWTAVLAASETLAETLNAADRRFAGGRQTLATDVARPLASILTQAVEALHDESGRPEAKRAALVLWGRSIGPVTKQVLAQSAGEDLVENAVHGMADLINPRSPAELQQLAVASLGRTAQTAVGPLLLEKLSGAGAATREKILDVLLSRPRWTADLLEAAEHGELRLATLGVDRQQRLLAHPDKALRDRAEALIEAAGSSSRSEVVAAYESALSLTPDVSHGREVFRKRCSVCHRLEDYGTLVGPDLRALTNRNPRWLLQTILDPNREVDARYAAWTAITEDGRTVTGLLTDESATSIRLRESEGKDHVLLRNEIEHLQTTQRSLMPEGLEREMSHQDVADVIAYVTQATRPEAGAADPGPLPRYAPQIAPFLLNDSIPTERRQQVIDRRPGMGAQIIQVMMADLPRGDRVEEYRRIPWAWRVSLAVGKRNDGGEIRDLLEVSMPHEGQPLQDWQAVVIGGGIINGLTQAGHWPRARIDEILAGEPRLAARWPQTLEQAALMADNEQVKPGTRYDALRMIALRDWSDAGPQLLRYLEKDVPDTLQMGAVSGLADIRRPQVIDPLIEAVPRLSKRNRDLAVEGLVRTPARAMALLEAIADGHIDRSHVDGSLLREHDAEAVRDRAAEILE